MAQMCSIDDLPKVILFYPPQMSDLAHRIAKEARTVQLGVIDWEQKDPSEGFPMISVEEVWRIKGASTVFLASFDRPEFIYEQIAVMTKIPRLGPSSMKIILPFFPSLTLQTEGGERGSGKEGDVPTTRTLARLLSCVPKSKSGPTEMVMFDIHHLQERFYFEDNVVPRLESAMELLINRLDDEIDQHLGPDEDAAGPGGRRAVSPLKLKQRRERRRKLDPDAPVVAFPDEARAKRFKKLFVGFEMIICTRMTKGSDNKVVVLEGEPKGRRIVLVDDLIFTGRTLIECGSLLRTLGATHLTCYVSHGVFSSESWKLFAKGPFDRVWLTDSIPSMAATLRNHGSPFEVLSLAPLIAPIVDEEVLLSTDNQQGRPAPFLQTSRL